MNAPIKMHFDDKLTAYVVRMPHRISLLALQHWKDNLYRVIADRDVSSISLLIDSNTHDFESLEALRYLRYILSTDPVLSRVQRAAFVAPKQYRPPEVVSDQEAYFNHFEEAYSWLEKQNQRL